MKLHITLGVKPDATPWEIKKAYRDKARANHPDKGGDTRRFQDIQNAYAILINPKKREHYERTGDERNRVVTLREQAEQKLCQFIVSFLEQSDGRYINPLAEIVTHVNNNLKESEKAPAILKAKAQKIREAKNRLKGESNVRLILESFAVNIEGRIIKVNEEREVMREVLKVIGELEYMVDVAVTPSFIFKV